MPLNLFGNIRLDRRFSKLGWTTARRDKAKPDIFIYHLACLLIALKLILEHIFAFDYLLPVICMQN